jgi:D-3-phosphoglycerate dehydrogenase
LHDTAALTEALANGHLGGAGLDHFVGERLDVDDPLCAMPNVVLTPHIGGATYDTEANHTTLIVDGLLSLLAGGSPSNLVNPEVLT